MAGRLPFGRPFGFPLGGARLFPLGGICGRSLGAGGLFLFDGAAFGLLLGGGGAFGTGGGGGAAFGSEHITWLLNWSDRNTAVLFGDSAGAVVVEEAGKQAEGKLQRP